MFLNTYEENENMIFYRTLPLEEVDAFSFEMLKANPLVEVITCGIKKDEEKNNTEFLLPVSNLITLKDYLSGQEVKESEINTFIERYKNQYYEIIEKLQNLMIPKEELILNFSYCFVEPNGGNLVLPLVPTEYSFLESHTLFEFESCIQNVLLTPKEKKEEKSKKKKEKKRKAKKENKLFDKIVKSFEANEKDDIFEFENDTMLPEGIHVISVRSTGEEYPLMFGPDIIGTDPKRCSIAFKNVRGMEAEHCSITLARGKYFLADLNTKEGTLLNGTPIEPGKTYELRSADLITVAGEDMVFSKRN